MPSESTKEAREACGCAVCLYWDDLGEGARSNAPAHCVARALDQFAEKKTQRQAKELSATAGLLAEFIEERDALRRRVAELEDVCRKSCSGMWGRNVAPGADMQPITCLEALREGAAKSHDELCHPCEALAKAKAGEEGAGSPAEDDGEPNRDALRIETVVTRAPGGPYQADGAPAIADAPDWKARAETAEALRELLIAHGGWMRDDGRTFLTMRVADGADLSCRATREDALNNANEEARRARGES